MPCQINITHCRHCRVRVDTDDPDQVRWHVDNCGPDAFAVLPEALRTRSRR